MKEQLKTYFNRYVSLSDNEVENFLSNISIKVFNKKDCLLNQGDVCHQRFFILEGLVRFYEIDDKGNERIDLFGVENWWITNLESFINETPSRQTIQALEKTKVLCINKTTLESLFESIPKLERAFRIITENMLIAIQRKDEVYMKQKSKERYSSLVNNVPRLFQRVPQYMIASYLNITPEYLSEIRKNS
ncbi:Crp/Fnr family transcriptional regulator [uncultured Algibacter sp.]|uniref:Crp/Fnr family transcriptional regulator n=1 Tax=uncultured Algibacter sp. TaxID=298659 RepID=UPI002634D8CB|nr:cyclic nucleotide-binding domain-containing protein [uncultured Algibacter sp.]